MNHYPEAITKLIRSFSTLPGIGKKTGERLALHLLHAPDYEAAALAADIVELKKKVKLCSVCFNLSDRDRCSICTDPRRDSSVICVVENPADMAAIEKSESFSGTYHILGGALSPIDGIGPDDIRLAELFARADSENVREIILATRTNVEGEATATYILNRMKSNRFQSKNIRITRIASGIPMGGDLQYVDPLTMQQAMEKRYGF
ncbi:recombination mediator RecR [Desulfospira joergensenii]|uniref:recombination mediator RecR n=1 Tax=Desulfospira joergensenii TaxID=53329 RepID=UPI0003B2E342|nr:recombination mediator RecR [Desulfospira joergensenii]